MYDSVYLSAISCPQEVIVVQIVKSVITNLEHTVTLALEHHTVIAGAVTSKTSKEN